MSRVARKTDQRETRNAPADLSVCVCARVQRVLQRPVLNLKTPTVTQHGVLYHQSTLAFDPRKIKQQH